LSDDQIAQLEELAAQGQAACDAKQFTRCHALFAQAQATLPWPPHEYYLGEALVGLGRLKEGTEIWRRMIAANGEPTDAVVVDAVELAKQRLKDVQSTIPTLLFQVPSAHLGKVNVKLDGEPLTASDLSRAVPLDPGTHLIQLSEPGYESERHELKLGLGEHPRILVALRALPVSPQPQPEPQKSWRVPVGWGLGAVGAGAMVGGLVVYLHKENLNRQLERDCGFVEKCRFLEPAVYDERTAKIRSRTTMANILAFGGAGLATLGVATLLWNAFDPQDPGQEVRVDLAVRPAYSGISFSGRF
jgi:hypothetical protein